jgi:hypothetical protein
LKSWQLDRKIGALSEKMKPVPSDVVRLDFDSFTEPEKQLFNRIWEIQEEHGLNPPADVIEANKELTFKALEIIFRRVLELFIFTVPKAFCWDEIEEWYFKLHFYNFFEDLEECLANVRRWSEKDRNEFLKDMKEHDMMNKVFRIPRGSEKEDLGKKRSKREREGDG